MREVIVDAAAEVDRPIVYAVAVIVAGFLPIYVLAGPSGKLFQPMADTTIFALLGSLLVTLTRDSGALRVAAARRRAASGAIAVFEWMRDRYERGSTGALRAPWRDDRRVARRCSSLSLADRADASAASSCRSSTKARSGCARRCRTRSRSRSRRSIVPQIRAILRSFPEVTVVASEHGRADDGTDPTGFFNAEFYVGLKPYGEWNGAYQHEARADRGDRQEARRRFPGITFNYTQPAEDAVDEAETGLKSSLDVKVFGTDLAHARGEGARDQERASSAVPRHQPRDARAGARAAEPHGHGRPREDRALRVERRRRQRLDRGRGRRHCGDAGRAGRAHVRSRRAARSRSIARRRSRSATSCSRRPTGSRCRCARSPTFRSRTARRSSTGRTTRATSACSTRWRDAISRARCKDAQQQVGEQGASCPPGYSHAVGRRVRGVHGVARAAAASCCRSRSC